MKIWLSRNSEVPIREQLIAQITIGVLGGDLAAGDKLPSTREIARRYSVHPNTVSSAYRQLANRSLIEFKRGSGFYVRTLETETLDADLRIEKFISECLKFAETFGLSPGDFAERIKYRFTAGTQKKLLVVESDENLREILIAEIESGTAFDAAAISFEEFEQSSKDDNVIFAAMIDEKPKIDPLLARSSTCRYLGFRSVSESMAGQSRPGSNDLIAIVSGWKTFLLLAKTMLVAAGIEPESIVVRLLDAQASTKGLRAVSMIICDHAAAKHFPGDARLRVFRLIDDVSINELKKLADEMAAPYLD
ncbi:MAG: GntR family transcriptional regulator [Pyrinomonadaceae bacterium]